jgi:uncharacterized protein YndB with AHSA1/START domain
MGRRERYAAAGRCEGVPPGNAGGVASNEIVVEAPPEAVWAVLSDGEAYGDWVVGTKAVSRVDAGWPGVGTAIDYELGIGPITVGDHTEVMESRRPELLVLRARFKRLGAAVIRLRLAPEGPGTRITMDEEPVEGLVEAVHNAVADAALGRRNDEALRRLKRLAEARA